MWKQQKDYSRIVQSLQTDISRSLELLQTIAVARTTTADIASSATSSGGEQSNRLSGKARRNAYGALQRISVLLCDERLPEPHEELLLDRLSAVVDALTEKRRREAAYVPNGSYLSLSLASNSRSLFPGPFHSLSSSSNSYSRQQGGSRSRAGSSAVSDTDSATFDEDATMLINPWARFAEDNFLWNHELGRKRGRGTSPGNNHRRGRSVLSASSSRDRLDDVESSSSRTSGGGVFLKPSIIAPPPAATAVPLLTATQANGISGGEQDTCEALFLEETELAVSALNILDDHPLSNTSLTGRNMTHHLSTLIDSNNTGVVHTRSGSSVSGVISEKASVVREGASRLSTNLSNLLRRHKGGSAENDSVVVLSQAETPRSSNDAAAIFDSARKQQSFATSVASSEYNSMLKEHFVRVMNKLEHPVPRCVERFVSTNATFIYILGGGGKNFFPPNPVSKDEQARLFGTSQECPAGTIRLRDVVEIFLVDRIFFISSLCDVWAQKMFAERGIPYTTVQQQQQQASSGTKPPRAPLLGSNRSSDAAPGEFVEPRSLTSQTRRGEAKNANRWGEDVTKLDISEPVRDFLPELLDSKIEIEALRLLMKLCDAETEYSCSNNQVEIVGSAKISTPLGTRSPQEEEQTISTSRTVSPSPSREQRPNSCAGDSTAQLLSRPRESSTQLLLDGISRKLTEQLVLLIAKLLDTKEFPFVGAFYESLLDLLVTTYNVIEFAALEEPGSSVGADAVFPLLVETLVSSSSIARKLWRIVKWIDHSSVAKRLPMMNSKGLTSYILLSFTAALDVAVRQEYP